MVIPARRRRAPWPSFPPRVDPPSASGIRPQSYRQKAGDRPVPNGAESSFLWHAYSPPNERSRGIRLPASARSRAGPVNASVTRTGRGDECLPMPAGPVKASVTRTVRGDECLPMPAGPSFAGSSDISCLITSTSRRILRTTSCAYVFGLEPWWRRVFQHRWLGVRHLPSLGAAGHQSGHQLVDNFRGIVVGTSAIWPRNGSDAPWVRTWL